MKRDSKRLLTIIVRNLFSAQPRHGF